MSTPTLVGELSAFADWVSPERMPPEVTASVKDRVLDTLGICLAAHAQGLGDGVTQIVASWTGTSEATLVGSEIRVPTPSAALLNGVLAHSLDFDDTHLPSVLHPSAAIVPAALAIGESQGAGGADVLAAAAVGIEITVRIGMGGYLAAKGNEFFNRGWHATSICGTLGAAAAAGKLLHLSEEGIGHAIGIAASFGSGVIEANRTGGTVKRLHCGWAAHAGITAALLARAGFTGPPTVLEGRFGFFNAFLDGEYDGDAVTAALGTHWEVPGIYFKPYPANHYTHAGIDAALALKRQFRLTPSDVKMAELGVPSAVLRTIGEPRDEKIRPRSGYHAQFSGPFTVATALTGGGGLGVYFDDFTDAKVHDPALLGLAARVSTVADAECDALFPRAFPAVLRLSLNDGRQVEHRIMANRGSPVNPLLPEELHRKFVLNAGQALPERQAETLAAQIHRLDQLDEVNELMALTRPAS
ncbi:MAG: MmgE/PrpD family protein [Chloroflexi bacterium]|nr:MmgE/PrpD family protein [Chloroflexota bacterium]